MDTISLWGRRLQFQGHSKGISTLSQGCIVAMTREWLGWIVKCIVRNGLCKLDTDTGAHSAEIAAGVFRPSAEIAK